MNEFVLTVEVNFVQRNTLSRKQVRQKFVSPTHVTSSESIKMRPFFSTVGFCSIHFHIYLQCASLILALMTQFTQKQHLHQLMIKDELENSGKRW